MRITRCTVESFGSYKTLEFDFSDKELTLIHGPTGSGKSSLLDIPCWILYGVTAKDGNADDIRPWTASSGETTKGTLEVETAAGPITVTRIRGAQHLNDLYWVGADGLECRGVNIVETQKLLSQALGKSYEKFTTEAYFHEDCASGTFFKSKAKDRREFLEGVVDLTFATSLATKLDTHRKEARSQIRDLDSRSISQDTIDAYIQSIDGLISMSSAWGKKRQREFEEFNASTDSNTQENNRIAIARVEFESNRSKRIENIIGDINNLQLTVKSYWDDVLRLKESELKLSQYEKEETNCKECKQPIVSPQRELIQKSIDKLRLKIASEKSCLKDLAQAEKTLVEVRDMANPHTLQTVKLPKAFTYEENPFTRRIEAANLKIEDLTRMANSQKSERQVLVQRTKDLEFLVECCEELKKQRLTNTVKELEKKTNEYLSSYFDSEFLVAFKLKDADTLDVSIQKSGYQCVYRQLSKGQRSLLRLCFSVATMKVCSDTSMDPCKNLFFDEALDGLDENFKIKAFKLFNELTTTYDSVFVVEHSNEFKNLFTNKYEVTLSGEHSTAKSST